MPYAASHGTGMPVALRLTALMGLATTASQAQPLEAVSGVDEANGRGQPASRRGKAHSKL